MYRQTFGGNFSPGAPSTAATYAYTPWNRRRIFRTRPFHLFSACRRRRAASSSRTAFGIGPLGTGTHILRPLVIALGPTSCNHPAPSTEHHLRRPPLPPQHSVPSTDRIPRSRSGFPQRAIPFTSLEIGRVSVGVVNEGRDATLPQQIDHLLIPHARQ